MNIVFIKEVIRLDEGFGLIKNLLRAYLKPNYIMLLKLNEIDN